MKAAELRELPDDELLARLEGLKEELFNLRFQAATGQLDNPMRIKQVRHDVARMLTVLRERADRGGARDADRGGRPALARGAPRRHRQRRAEGRVADGRAAELPEEDARRGRGRGASTRLRRP